MTAAATSKPAPVSGRSDLLDAIANPNPKRGDSNYNAWLKQQVMDRFKTEYGKTPNHAQTIMLLKRVGTEDWSTELATRIFAQPIPGATRPTPALEQAPLPSYADAFNAAAQVRKQAQGMGRSRTIIGGFGRAMAPSTRMAKAGGY